MLGSCALEAYIHIVPQLQLESLSTHFGLLVAAVVKTMTFGVGAI